MVLLTLVLQNNGETIFLDQSIPQVHFMKLISCSLYNSWHNLKSVGQIQFKEDREVLASIPQGHYIYQSLAEELTQSLTSFKNQKKIGIETNKPNSVIKITVWEPTDGREISLSQSLHQLINSGPTLTTITYVKKLNSPSAYFIHCDLIDRNFNFVNNKKSDLLTKIDTKGRPYEKITYESSTSQPIRDCSTGSHVNSITISVKDENGELFAFNGMPLEFELELINFIYNGEIILCEREETNRMCSKFRALCRNKKWTNHDGV